MQTKKFDFINRVSKRRNQNPTFGHVFEKVLKFDAMQLVDNSIVLFSKQVSKVAMMHEHPKQYLDIKVQ